MRTEGRNLSAGARPRRRLLACAALLLAGTVQASAPDFETVRDSWRSSEARLLDRTGQPVSEVRVDFDERRLDWVSARALSPPLVRALLVAEDKRFLEHGGVDWQALAGATWDNLWRTFEGRRPRGASTLTMQLAGLIDPALRLQGTRRSVGQKWDQGAAARDIERRWTKAQILEAYFNLAPFRGELRGISAASRGLFGKGPDGVDAREAVLLAALLRGPNASADRVAVRACAVALRLKPAPACDDIRALADRVLARRYRLEPRWQDAPALARRLLKEPGEQRMTTLDARLQHRVLQALGRERADSAVIVLDNASGEVLVWGGGPDDADAVLRRLPAGGMLQPFLYGTAIEQRWLSAASVLDDSPALLPLPPGQAEGELRGMLSVRSALALAADIPALRVRAMVGDDVLGSVLHAHGLDGLSATGGRVGLVELANAYRTFANDGVWSAWSLEPPAQRGTDQERPGRRLWPSAVAWIVGDLLSFRTAGGEPRPWSALMSARAPDRSTWWAVGFTRRYTVALRSPRPAAAVWQAVVAALEMPSAEVLAVPAGLESTWVHFEPEIEVAREEYFLPGTQQGFVDATSGHQDVPHIVQPTSGVKLVSAGVPAGRQQLLLEARPALPGLSWAINGETLPAIEGRALWSPRPGVQRLELLDARGQRIQMVEFEVRVDPGAPATPR